MKRIQFASDHLIEQILERRKTASVAKIGEVALDEDEYNHALVVGERYEIYDSALNSRGVLRITGMELCRWDDIPEKLWRGETNASAVQFRADHQDWFGNPSDNFEFIAYYFELI